ncbi:MAG: hypothetical protein H0T05_04865 [Acidobacteria bacterium]|nr:hypothetical protein [Acidobacteriota bacterium]MBA3887223.1 hypothetical protein [Acidobacteriota bacterium]
MKNQWVFVGVLVAALAASDAFAQHTAPNQQPTTAEAAKAPAGEVALGNVRIPRSVMADGKPLAAGTYQVRLTADPAKPDAVGATEELSRWAEFVQGGNVRGREVVTIVPAGESKFVVQDAPPPSGGSKVQMLRGNEYMRVWINRGGNHYLIHFPVGAN